MKNATKGRVTLGVALLVTMIGVAPPAHAKTQKQRIASLEKTVKSLAKTSKAQARTIKTLQSSASLANLRAADAQASFAALEACIFVQPAGAVSVLDSATSASFVQGDATLGVADVFQWFPVERVVIAPDGPSYLALIDEACVAQPSPAPRSKRTGWNPRPLVLRETVSNG